MRSQRDNTGHAGEVYRELEELRRLAISFLSQKFSSRLEAERRIRMASLAYNIVEDLYRRGLINDENTPSER
jgi:SOS response regulatory protein OraA/RecX